MPRRSILRTASLAGLAVAGVVLGHAITYVGLSPIAIARAAWLTATGHGYLPAADRLGLIAALAVLAGAFLRGFEGDPREQPRRLERRLAPLMVVGFVMLEITERVAAGSGFGDLARVLPLGVSIQIGIAFLLAGAIRWCTRTGAAIASAARGQVPSPRARLVVALRSAPPQAGRTCTLRLGNRGPPEVS